MADPAKEERLVKIQFYDQEIGYENIWALPLGDGTYRLENSPFFIYDISQNDIVSAAEDDEGVLQFLPVVKRSGNRTLRARSENLLQDPTFRKKVASDLREMGCQLEEYREKLLSISVPPETDMDSITTYLTAIGLSWEYGFPAALNSCESDRFS